MSGFSKFAGKKATPSHSLQHMPFDADSCIDKILTSKYNKPFPVTLLPSAIGYYLGLKQGERQAQLLAEIQALDIHDHETVKKIAGNPK